MQFKNKARQRQRNQHLKQLALKAQHRGTPLPNQVQKAQPAQQAGKKLPAAKRRLQESREDSADFSREYRYLKKLKQGKITEVLGRNAFKGWQYVSCNDVFDTILLRDCTTSAGNGVLTLV